MTPAPGFKEYLRESMDKKLTLSVGENLEVGHKRLAKSMIKQSQALCPRKSAL
jgi:hypothetical protein